MKQLTILGSTGSIGCSTLDVVRHNPEHFRVVALVAGKNVTRMVYVLSQFVVEIVTSAIQLTDHIVGDNFVFLCCAQHSLTNFFTYDRNQIVQVVTANKEIHVIGF